VTAVAVLTMPPVALAKLHASGFRAIVALSTVPGIVFS
jgi:hypothetical protein